MVALDSGEAKIRTKDVLVAKSTVLTTIKSLEMTYDF